MSETYSNPVSSQPPTAPGAAAAPSTAAALAPVSVTLPTATVHGPYEDFGIALCELIGKVIDGQPPEVKKQLWQWYIEDIRAWRDFWKVITGK